MNRRWLQITDPLSLVELGPPGPVRTLLEKVADAWAYANQDEALRLCHAAMRCASQTTDIAGTTLAQLYLAHTHARSGNLEEGASLARRAADCFEWLGDRHNALVARLLLAHLERSLQELDQARLDYQQALDICQTLQLEGKAVARQKAELYGQIAVEIQNVITGIAADIADHFDQTCRFLDSIPILRLSDGPDSAIFERANVVGYISMGQFLIAGRIYYLCPLDDTRGNRIELKAGAAHFALSVLEDGWLDPISEKEDYVLVRQETRITQEGPWVLWTGKEWVACRFERDPAGRIRLVSPPPTVIGKDPALGSIVAFLKPLPFS